MPIVQVAANRHTVVATGWTDPANAYALTGDNVYATIVSAKNSTFSGDFGFPDITTGQIPDDAAILSVKVVVEWGMTASVTQGLLGLLPRVANANGGTETTKSSITEEQSEATFSTVPTLSQLRAMQTSDTVEARVRVTKGPTNTAMTANLDFVYLEIEYQIPTEYTDSATVYLDLQPSGSDSYLPLGYYEIAVGSDDGIVECVGAGFPPDGTKTVNTTAQNARIEYSQLQAGGDYTWGQALLRWDTSSIPDDPTIETATLRLVVTSNTAISYVDLRAQWYDWSPTIGTEDYNTTPTADAHAGTAMNVIGTGTVDFTLTNLNNINKTGYTYLKVYLRSVNPPPTSSITLQFATLEDTTLDPARLILTWTEGQYEDSATVYLDLQASGTESYERVDSATVYLNIFVYTFSGQEAYLPWGQFVISDPSDDGFVSATEDAYPPTTNLSATTTGFFETIRNTLSLGNYFWDQALLRWDTSAIPDDAIIESIVLRLDVSSVEYTDASMQLRAEWYDWSPTIGTEDYDSTPTANAHAGTSLSTWPEFGAEVELTLTNFTSLNKTGYTYLRLYVEGDSAPTSANRVQFGSFESGLISYGPARLLVTWLSNAQVAWLELETPVHTASIVGQVSWIELETPEATVTGVYTDTATVYLNLACSGTELLEAVETDTAYLDLSVQSTEEYTRHDAATVYTDLTASGTEIAEYTEAATAYLDLSVVSGDIAEFVDSAQVGLLLVALSSELAEYVETQTVYFDLVASGTETHERETTDAATTYLDLEASGADVLDATDAQTAYLDLSVESTEQRESSDSETVYLDLNAEGTDEYTPGGVENTDAETIYFDIEASGIEYAELTEAAEIYVDLDASATDVSEYVETGTVYLDLQPDSAEVADYSDTESVYLDILTASVELAEFVDTDTTYLDLTVESIEEREQTDAETVYLDIEGTGTDEFVPGGTETTDAETAYLDISVESAEALETVEADTAYLDLEASGTEELDATDAQEVYLDIQLDSTDVGEFVDTANVYADISVESTELLDVVEVATVYLDLAVTSTDVSDLVDSESVYFDIQPSGVDELTTEGTDAATVPVLLSPATDVEVLEAVDEATVPLALSVQSVEEREQTDSVTIPLVLTVAGVEVQDAVDVETVYFDLQASGVEELVGEDADEATIYLDLSVESVDVADLGDSAEAYLNLLASGVEVAVYVDDDSVYVDIEGTGVEELLREFLDDDTVVVILTPESIEWLESDDTQLVRLTLGISSDTTAGLEDAATVNLYILPGRIVIQVDFVLEIVGIIRRWKIVDSFPRWKLYELRRWKWRSSRKAL